eukprot:TRINITY_DN814_c0_g1_i2.p1 TRINITY_DN814_c0_g1~~TRINITY_DN814_c0_g1_i2.p1  ORF type:complete len:274 (+),score=19.07 TRINITY_DN814_c0_g1_i2:162-983(+)
MLSLAPAAFVLLLALFVGSNVVSSAPGPPGLPPRDAPTAARCKPTSHHVVNSTKAATDLAEHLEFCGGTHVTVDWHGLVHIAQTLVARNGTRLQIRSSVSGLAVIDGQGTARLLTVRTGAELQLKDLVLQNGYALSSGGAVHVETGAKLLVDSCTFQLNAANNSFVSPAAGGAIYNDGDDMTIVKSTFIQNWAGDGGAIYNGDGAAMMVTDSTFIRNLADYSNSIEISSSTSDNAQRSLIRLLLATGPVAARRICATTWHLVEVGPSSTKGAT